MATKQLISHMNDTTEGILGATAKRKTVDAGEAIVNTIGNLSNTIDYAVEEGC